MRGGLLIVVLLLCAQLVGGCAARSGGDAAQVEALIAQAQKALTPQDGTTPAYKKAIELYEDAADLGSDKAAYALAALYRDCSATTCKGLGLDAASVKDKSFEWMEKAAKAGWPQAQYELAAYYLHGVGGETDHKEALTWLEKAADNDVPLAQRFLGALYMNGTSSESAVTVKPDLAKAAQWYKKAAQQGDGPSQAALGAMYARGKGVTRNVEEAIKWSGLAAKQGAAGAQQRLAALYAGQDKSNAAIAKNILTYRDAYKKGDPRSGFNLGRLQFYAPGKYNNVNQALKLFRDTAKTIPESAMMLGVAYEEGKGVKQNAAKAAEWYQKAADMGEAEANAYLARAYYDGKGVTKDATKAVNLLQKGAAKGDAKSKSGLAAMHSLGAGGLDSNHKKALAYALEAAHDGDVQAMNMLGVMYEKGIGTAADKEEAKRWYKEVMDYAPDQSGSARIEPYSSLKRMAKSAYDRLSK